MLPVLPLGRPDGCDLARIEPSIKLADQQVAGVAGSRGLGQLPLHFFEDLLKTLGVAVGAGPGLGRAFQVGVGLAHVGCHPRGG